MFSRNDIRRLCLALALLAPLAATPCQAASPKKSTRPTAKAKATPAAPEKAPAEEPPPADGELPLAARGAVVLDAYTGQVLYAKNADEPQFPASTTKIMTALLVIEAGNLDKEVEITAEDSKVGESSLQIKPGERYTRRQMLYGLLLKSANDVAYALGRDNAGTMEAFALKMTQRARELGATATCFRNPHGLHHADHVTSPYDLALIARAAMQQPLFRQIVSTQQHPWVTATGIEPLRNHNRLLGQFPGCTGIKTGYTIPAQQVLASAALRDNREVIAIVMHTNKPGIWEDSKRLLSYGLDHCTDAGILNLEAANTPFSHP